MVDMTFKTEATRHELLGAACSPRKFIKSAFAVLLSIAALARVDAAQATTVGAYLAAKSQFYLTQPSSGTVTPNSIKIKGAQGSWLPVLGAGAYQFGLYDPQTGTFHFRLEGSTGPITKSAQIDGFKSNWLPVAGDWDGDLAYGVGLYDPQTGTFYLKNQLSNGPADIIVRLANTKETWRPLVGDWDGDGVTTIGAYNPGNGQFYLRNINVDGPADLTMQIQGLNTNLQPVAADWNSDGVWSPGLYNPAVHTFYWRNALTTGPQEGSMKLAGVSSSALPVTRSTSVTEPTPAVTDVGVATGDAVSATIGTSGGTLRSPDNTLLLTIPAGALAANTKITIQPITNHAHGGKGKAYRLLPNGQTFKQPVKLTFSYTNKDLNGTAASALGGAFQTHEGYWSWVDKPVVDTVAKTVTISTTHFTDFSRVEGYHLSPGAAKVMVKGTVSLSWQSCYPAAINDNQPGFLGTLCQVEDDILAPLIGVSEWAVNGVAGGTSAKGTIKGSGSPGSAIYHAPAVKPKPDTVAVSARIIPAQGEVLLVSSITIVDDAKAYQGEFAFTVGEGANTIKGKTNVTWKQFEDSGNVVRYIAKGSIRATIRRSTCDPLSVIVPILSGTEDAPRSTLVRFTETSPFHNHYFFGLAADPDIQAIMTCYHDDEHKVPYKQIWYSREIGIPIATCLGGDSFRQYDDKLLLWGFLLCSNPTFHGGWSFKAIVPE